MGELSARNFGLIIAYLIPGFVALWGLSSVFTPVQIWLQGAGSDGPSVGSAVFVVLASLGCGMTANVLRWALLDSIHQRSGLKAPTLNFSKIQDKLDGFDRIVADHYQHYQFCGNTLVSVFVSYVLWRAVSHQGSMVTDAIFIFLEALFFAGSRNTLQIFYRRAVDLLGESKGSK